MGCNKPKLMDLLPSRQSNQRRVMRIGIIIVRPMSMSDVYVEKWKDLRRREWLVIGLFVGYLPILAGIGWLLFRVTTSETPIIIVAITWMSAFACAGLRVSFFRCPRCDQRFYMGKYFVMTLGRRCPHCGLQRYAKA